MDNSHAPDNSRVPTFDEVLSDQRWVPCLYDQDELCRHIACQEMEPPEDDDNQNPHGDEPAINTGQKRSRHDDTP